MKKSKPKQIDVDSYVTYVRMSEYYKSFYEIKYGAPVSFPDMHPLSIILENNIVFNPSLKELTKYAYTQMAYEYDFNNKLFDVNIACPPDDEKNDFLAVVLPKTIRRHDKVYNVNSMWQLGKDGAIAFREELKREFWVDMEMFIEQCFCRAHALGESCNREAAISDFLIAYDIPMSHFESLLRAERRFRIQQLKKIEKQREFMEERSCSIFLYT